MSQLEALTCIVASEKDKALKTLINHIYDNSPCVLLGLQVRRKSDYRLVMRARKAMVTEMIDEGYVKVIDGVICLMPKAVVMLDDGKQIEWMTKHCVV